jgi:hypothetical protein
MKTREWHKGEPPYPGWWNASAVENPDVWRWWNGEYWSRGIGSHSSAEVAGVVATARDPDILLHRPVKYTYYWPENARVGPAMRTYTTSSTTDDGVYRSVEISDRGHYFIRIAAKWSPETDPVVTRVRLSRDGFIATYVAMQKIIERDFLGYP